MGSVEHPEIIDGGVASYSVPKEAQKVFYEGIFSNDLITKYLPVEVKEPARKIQFTGTDRPSIPINWRFAESAAALKGLEASVIGALLKRKYGVDAPSVEINTFGPTIPTKHPNLLTHPQRPCPALLHVHSRLDPGPIWPRARRIRRPPYHQEARYLFP